MRVIAVASATIGLLLGGCVHERLARPLTPGDVERINDGATSNNWFRVEYVEPIATEAKMHVPRPVGLASVDAVEIGIRTWTGAVEIIPTEMVTGVTVKDRARGVAAGAGLGLAAGALFIGAVFAVAYAFPDLGWPDTNGAAPPDCESCRAKGITAALLLPAAIGGVVGYFVGSRRTYDLGPTR